MCCPLRHILGNSSVLTFYLGCTRKPWTHPEPQCSYFIGLHSASYRPSWFWQGLSAGPCSEVLTPGEQSEMTDKGCLCGNDFPSLTRSIPVPCSVSENSCITHLAKKGCKTQLTLSVLVSRDSLWPYPGSIPACAAHTGSIGKKFSMHGYKNSVLGSWQSFLGMSGFRGGVIWLPRYRSPRHPAGAAGF